MVENKPIPINTAKEDLTMGELARPFFFLFLQLGLISLVIYQFNVEEHLGLPQLMPIVLVAFVINAFLPKAKRLAFFFFASLIPILYFFGWRDGVVLIGVALLMVGTCHLPISLVWRKLGVVAIALSLAVGKYLLSQHMLTKGTFPEGFTASSQMISVLGTMFMFRMIIYLYELKYEKEKASSWQRLSYFFMLPNLCFPIFPIVDYKTFKRTYYDHPDFSIYQKGINLIIVGLIQLLVYRVLYYLAPDAAEVTGFWVLWRYLVLSYLLLIRLNGILNIAVGILRLFGFNLPDIFNYMFLSRGFDDLWRRVNIYWKDFMVKIVYYPLYFRFRKSGTLLALVIGTVVTFILNWAFHAYQWFWVLGEFPTRKTEMLTWGILGLLVLVAVVRQQKTSKKNQPTNLSSGAKAFTETGLVFLTFGGMSLIYSFMISPSIPAWWRLISQLKHGSFMDWGILILGTFSLYLIAVWIFRSINLRKFSWVKDIFNTRNKVILINLILLAGISLSSTSIVDRQVKRISGYSTKPFINHHLNLHDQRKQFKGYYEELMFADNFSSLLWQMEYKKPIDWLNVANLELMKNTGFLTELEPSSQTTFKRGKFTTNHWGMRDREYSLKRPPNTNRMAIVGGSAEMGAGVNDEEVFEQLLEDKLTQNLGTDSTHFEILNFAISGSSVIRNIEKIRLQVLNFHPQQILVFTHKGEDLHINKTIKWFTVGKGSAQYTADVRDTIPWFKDFEEFMQREKVEYSEIATTKELSDTGWKILDWGYRTMAELCRNNGVELIMVYLPGTLEHEAAYQPFQEIAQKYDLPFINLSGLYESHPIEELQVSPWDSHPNAFAHGIIANRLYEELVEYLKLEKEYNVKNSLFQ